MILYSDVVGLLSTEMIYEKDSETDEVIEMSLMDKISDSDSDDCGFNSRRLHSEDILIGGYDERIIG